MIEKIWRKVVTYPLLFITILLISVTSVTTVALANFKTVKINASIVNIRTGPGLSYQVMTTVKGGQEVKVVTQENNWYKVRLSNDQVGWVASWLVNENEVTTNDNKVGNINATSVIVHEEADDTSKNIATLAKNQTVTTIYSDDSWTQVYLEGTIGWIPTSSIEITSETANIPITNGIIAKHESTVKKADIKTADLEKIVTVTADAATLYQSADNMSGSLGILQNGSECTFISDLGNGWYKVKTAKGTTGYLNKNYISVSKIAKLDTPPKLKQATIVLDAGHGGDDVGAQSNTGEYEKTYTLKTVKAVQAKLEAAGAKVILTRSNDSLLDLAKIADISNNNAADAFISFHFDSTDSSNQANGSTTYFYHSRDQKLATAVNNQIENLPIDNRGTAFGNYQVIRENQRPGLLLELGYINSDIDFKQIDSSAYREKVADAVTKGLQDYFG